MELFKRWGLRVGSVTTAATLAVLVPTMAWASSHPGLLAAGEELARRYPRRRGVGGFGLIGACCCIAVVLVVVLIVVLMRRRRQPPPGPPQGY